jgi:hypothetical protein
MQPAQLGGLASKSATSIWAARAMRAPRAVVMSAEVNCLAAKGAAVVDERLVFLDGHFDEMRTVYPVVYGSDDSVMQSKGG